MPLFEGTDLDCVRGERLVFEGVRFALDAGGALVLTGANGSGKSTLLRLMAGLLRPARGLIRWDGSDIADGPGSFAAAVQYVGHADAIKPALGVAENVAFWASLRGAPATNVAGALDAFGIAHLARLPARYLSAGQRRRTNLARLLASPARLWLLDEPTTALDADSAARLARVIARHRAGGGMVVVSTHTELGLDGAASLDLSALQMAAS